MPALRDGERLEVVGDKLIYNAGPSPVSVVRSAAFRHPSVVKFFGPTAYYRLGESDGDAVARDEIGAHHGIRWAQPNPVPGALFNESTNEFTKGRGGTLFAAARTQRIIGTTMGTFGSSILTSSVSLWMRTTTTAHQNVLGTVSDGTALLYQVLLNSDNSATSQPGSKVTCFHLRGANTQTLVGGIAEPQLYDGNWHHVIWVISAGAAHTAYVDGKPVVVTMGATQAPTAADFQYPLILAARNNRGTTDSFADIALDEVAFFPTQLSAQNAQTFYWTGLGGESTDDSAILLNPGKAVSVQAGRTITCPVSGAATIQARDAGQIAVRDRLGLYRVDDYLIGSSDDSPSFQAAIDAAVAQGGGIVEFSPRSYTFNTAPAVDPVARTNSIIKLPANTQDAGTLIIRGTRKRTVLNALLSGLSYSASVGPPSFIGGGTSQLMSGFGVSGFANWRVEIRDLEIGISQDPTYAVIDLGRVTRAFVENVRISTPALPPPGLQTSPWAFGVRMPGNLNFGSVKVRDVEVAGCYVGLVVHHAHTILENTIPNYCQIGYGLVAGADTHGCTMVGAQAQACVNYLAGYAEATGVANLSNPFYLHGNLDLEYFTSGTFQLVNHISDAANLLKGNLYYLLTVAGVGHSDTLTVSGATGITKTNWGA